MNRQPDDADFSAVGTYVKIETRRPVHITSGFNLALFAFASLKGLLMFLMTSPMVASASFEGLVLSSLLDLFQVAATLLIAAAFLKAFWRRLISPLGSLRPITYNESVAILLMISVIFGG